MSMTILELQYFVEVAQQKNFTKAAEALYVTEPTISYHIKKLERKIGMVLIRRTTKQVVLTPEGERFYQYAKQVTDAYGQLEQAALKMVQPKEQPFRLGITPMVFQFYLKQELEAFRAAYPKEMIAFTIEDEDSLLKRLRQQTIDFAVMRSYDGQLDIDTAEFDAVLLSKEKICLVFSPQMMQMTHESISPEEMTSYPFVCAKKDSYLAKAVEKFQLQNQQPMHYYDGIWTNDVLTIMAVVTTGKAVTCAGTSIGEYLRTCFGVQTLPISPPIYQYLYFVFPKNKKMSQKEKRLMDALRKKAGETVCADGQESCP